MRPQAVLDEAGRRAQLTELLRITVRARVARSNDENGLQRLVDPEPGLAAEIARRADSEVAEAAERLANSLSGEYEAASDDTLERMQAELESLVLTRGIEAAKAELADLEARKTDLERNRRVGSAAITGAEPLTVEGLEAEIRRLHALIHEATDQAIRSLTARKGAERT